MGYRAKEVGIAIFNGMIKDKTQWKQIWARLAGGLGWARWFTGGSNILEKVIFTGENVFPVKVANANPKTRMHLVYPTNSNEENVIGAEGTREAIVIGYTREAKQSQLKESFRFCKDFRFHSE